jgi:hypothetical protein
MKIFEKPETIYTYLIRNEYTLQSSQHVMAENNGMAISLSVDQDDVVLTVLQNGEPIFDYPIPIDTASADSEELSSAYEYLLEQYLEYDSEEAEDEFEDAENEIAESEDYLDSVMCEMIESIVDSHVTEDEMDEAVKGIKEIVCDVLTKRYGFDVRRPMFLIDGDGNRTYEEYPYRKLNGDTAQTVFC